MVTNLSVPSSCLYLCSFRFWEKYYLNLECYCRNCLLGHRKKIAKFLMRTFTYRSTFLYGFRELFFELYRPLRAAFIVSLKRTDPSTTFMENSSLHCKFTEYSFLLCKFIENSYLLCKLIEISSLHCKCKRSFLHC
jgi:hypothetical protein